MVLTRLYGWLLIFAGWFFVIAMPSIRQYMPEKFQNSTVLIGLVMLGIGIWLLVKG